MLETSEGRLGANDLRRFTRAEYDRLVAEGWFAGEPVELLAGHLVRVSPQGAAHAATVRILTRLLVPRLVGRADVGVRLPFAASDDSEPEPDLALVAVSDDRSQHPSQAFLVIEVSASSQERDRGLKARIYADAGVPEYWIVDIAARSIEVRLDPRDGRYARVCRVGPGATLAPAAFPDVVIAVDDVLAA